MRIAPMLALAAALATAGCVTDTTTTRQVDGFVRSPTGPDPGRYGGLGGVYPSATRATWTQAAYSVDGFSRLDALFPAAVVARGTAPSAWRRAAEEPAIRYDAPAQFGGGRLTLDQYLERNPTTGLLIARDDMILVERYRYARNDSHRLTSFSMAKTITAMLVGIAVRDGAIASIDDPAERYVPELAGRAYGRTPIRHLLTMSSGVRFREDYDGTDDVAALSRATIGGQGPGGASAVLAFDERVAPPGTRWSYASGETQVLGLVLRRALGRPIVEYLSERVWKPMGAEADASWLVDRSGQEVVYGFFNATLRDYARLGMLLARGGRAGERALIPAAWIAEATRAHFTAAQTGRGLGYGFQTWVMPENDGSFVFLGVRGQALFVDPGRRLVMVHTAVRPDSRDPRGAETFALWRAVKRDLAR
ncbi:MAG: serine hydrolase [Alphaproteobacteria bacterium]|nr:serine hydrolase [Alphaproteobacteria bacterium]